MKLTIITPTFNSESTIDRLIASLCIQIAPFKWIVVDNKSSDRTCDKIMQSGLDVYLISEIDSGIYDAMNKGIKSVSDGYVLFLNSDDLLEPGALSILCKLIDESKECDIISCSSNRVDSNGFKLETLLPSKALLFFKNSIPHPSTIISVDCLKKLGCYDDQYKIAADYDFFLRAMLKNKRFKIDRSIIASHYIGGASTNSSLSLKETDAIRYKNLGEAGRIINLLLKVRRWLRKFF